MKKPFGDSVARFIGIGKGTETQNFSKPKRQKGGGKTLYWGCGMIMANGVRVRKALQPPQHPISRIYTPPLSPWVLMRSLMQFLDVLQRR